jgi:multidrug resistance efflux pump
LAALLPYPVTIKAAATVRPDGDLRLVEATLRAPVTGVIQDLALRNPGQVLSAGEVVAHLAPAQAPLLVKALVNQNDISQIKPGQAVTLRIDRGDNHATEG